MESPTFMRYMLHPTDVKSDLDDEGDEQGPASEDYCVNLPRRHIRLFLISTVHDVFLMTGALASLPGLIAGRHITRLVDVTQSVLCLPEGRAPRMSMCKPVAKRAVKELTRTFGKKVKTMLFVADASVEESIARCIITQTLIELEQRRRCCTFPKCARNLLLIVIAILPLIVAIVNILLVVL
ncbi:hypothetical protein JOB18_021444 [Solea senegalensis]|uniref:Uncharacterized protein n=1 Tax=Solea senegalensis TaxID=28829 RepID=A0AAV6R2Y3_SOLSE|nr:hypothetical protein JOB18_021444 [Solea senegalensis]